MYFADMSPYTYKDTACNFTQYNIGWLRNGLPFETGDVDPSVLAVLHNITRVAVLSTRGLHICDLGDTCCEYITITYNGITKAIGSAEIRVFGKNGVVYAAPNMLFHYIKVHKYKPPEAFLAAILSEKNSKFDNYLRNMRKLGLQWELLLD